MYDDDFEYDERLAIEKDMDAFYEAFGYEMDPYFEYGYDNEIDDDISKEWTGE